tara:strand:+ start:16334 stop:16999 length:666 start_codon:yes stop_codon:yes gene_type:complete
MDNPKEFDFPITIARIEVQKKNHARYSLYSDTEFILGVSDAALAKLNIRKGSVLTTSLYEQIIKEETFWKTREYLIRLLSRRDHASFELQQKAAKKEFTPEIINQIIEELEQKGYINNQAFALKYVHDKFEFNKWGSNRIRTELIRKNIPKHYIESAIDHHFGSEKVQATLMALTLKKKSQLLRTSPEKRKKKLFDFLMRKGYDTNSILKEIDALVKLVEE